MKFHNQALSTEPFLQTSANTGLDNRVVEHKSIQIESRRVKSILGIVFLLSNSALSSSRRVSIFTNSSVNIVHLYLTLDLD